MPGELTYAVRGRVVRRTFGELCRPLAVVPIPPLMAALLSGAWPVAAAEASVVGLLVVAGARLRTVEAPTDLQTNEALVVVALAFIAAALAMTPAFILYGLRPSDALFEAISGVTTTGLSMVPDPEGMPADFLFARAWLQWYGGLGIVTLSALLLPHRGNVASRFSADESRLEQTLKSDPVGGSRALGRAALIVYGALTVGGFGALLAAGASPFQGLVHVASSVSTGGFAAASESLGALGVPARAVVIVLFTLGALPLFLIGAAARDRPSRLWTAPQPRALLAFCAIASLALLLFGPGAGGSLLERAGHAVALGFSAQTTTGFSTTDVGSLGAASLAVLIFAMFVGGGSSSTAGGIKVWRALAAIRLLWHSLVRTAHPRHAVSDPTIGGMTIEAEEASSLMRLILLFGAVLAASWMSFLAAGHDPMASLFEVTSATGTVGLSTGLTGPGLETPLKFVLCADMLMGRLEVIAVLVLVIPATWFGRRRESS